MSDPAVLRRSSPAPSANSPAIKRPIVNTRSPSADNNGGSVDKLSTSDNSQPSFRLLDKSSQEHVYNLLTLWLTEVNLNVPGLTNALLFILLRLADMWEIATNSPPATFDKVCNRTLGETLWIQLFEFSSPSQSRILPGVYHGEALSGSAYDVPCTWLQGNIGGTIRLYGIPPVCFVERHPLVNVMMTAVYTVWSLWLEGRVMRDHCLWGCDVVEATMTVPCESGLDKEMPQDDHTSRKGLVQWLVSGFRGNANVAPGKPRVPSPPKPNKANIIKQVSSASLLLRPKEKAKEKSKEEIQNTLSAGVHVATDDPMRFSKLLAQLQGAPVSSSPYCLFEPPRILERLEDDEKDLATIQNVMRLKSKQKNPKKSIVQRTSSLLSLMTKGDTEHNGNHATHSNDITLSVPQSFAAYSALRMPPLVRDTKVGLGYLMLETNTLQAYLQHQHLILTYTCHPVGCPQRPCLGPFLCRMVYFTQPRQDTNGGEPLPPHDTTDHSLGETLLGWFASADETCKCVLSQKMKRVLHIANPSPTSLISEVASPDGSESTDRPVSDKTKDASSSSQGTLVDECSPLHGCDRPTRDHVISFSHGSAKIAIYMDVDKSLPPEPHMALEYKNSIMLWMVCNTCEKESERMQMSEPTFNCSFGKYLEWLLYSKRFTIPPTLCEHTPSKTNTSWHFQLCTDRRVTIKLVYEQVTLYELRPPRLQAIPVHETMQDALILPTPPQSPYGDSSLINSSADMSVSYVSLRTLREWSKALRSDVDVFFEAIGNHIELLHHYLNAEYRRQLRSTTDPAHKQEIQASWHYRQQSWKALRSAILDHEQSTLQRMLNENPLETLNDFRRLFASRASAISNYLEAWQKNMCPDLLETCSWDAPEYINSETVHSFPGSSILVRQDEPSSIIAYTLSSIDYRKEMDSNVAAENIVIGKPVQPPTPLSTRSTPLPASNERQENGLKNGSEDRVIDGYVSIIERKYIAPSTGAATETASFRTMVLETIKASASELHHNQQRRFHDFVGRFMHSKDDNSRKKWYPSIRMYKENVQEQGVPNQMSQRVIVNQEPDKGDLEQVVTELKVSSYFYKAKPSLAAQPDSDSAMNASPATEAMATQKSPHIKHKFTHNNVEFTCIVYFAHEFETLRRQCGIDQLMIQSLARCEAWQTSGGKSKSRFYKTQDDRLVIKEMVNAWNNVEREAFLKFAPKYLGYMKRSAEAPSILTKIFGFYTLRIQNLTDKRMLLDMDVIVMEHLFYGMANRRIQTFDFKGIRERRIDEMRKASDSNCTMWDGDWIDGYRLLLPTNEHSKTVIENAIKNDTEFLAKSNIMDYSLLVSVDEKTRGLTVGIVDFIGTYTWYKKMESMSKATLKPNKEVTVLPPDQYKWRFCRLLEDYFVSVPGKFDWVDDRKLVSNAVI